MKLIPLTQGKFAQVDDEGYEYLNQWKWHVKKTINHYSARRWITQGEAISMHRQIMRLTSKEKMVIDHKDHNPLNNQKSNLRICTTKQNTVNRTPHGKSKYLGVWWHEKTKKWIAHIKLNGKPKHLGGFNNEEDAAKLYDIKAKELYGEFANLNFKTA
jgi:hypothetical protein